MTTSRDGLRRAAYHEAGHAVLDHVYGFELGPISIARDGSGRCASRKKGRDGMRGRALAEAVCVTLLAGLEAELRGAPGAGEDELVSMVGSDLLAARGLMQLFTRDEDALATWTDAIAGRARWILDAHWPAVQLVAAVLLERRRVSGKRAAELIARAPSLVD